jgi:hypothetical protein
MAVVVGAAAGTLAVAGAAAAAGMPRSAVPAARAGDPSAIARRTGHRVEVAGLDTETSRVFAEPNGTFTTELSARPSQVRRGSAWVPVDTTLRRSGDGLIPGAATVGLRFSTGGADPLASVVGDSWSMLLTWPAALPSPTVSGDTATYADVLPGVDLVVVAQPDGFGERLVVRSRAAAADPALTQIGFQLRISGMAMRADQSGDLSGVDATGATVVSAPAPVMWDARGARRPVGLSLIGGMLELRPDAAMLADPATRFPVTIDPSFAAKRLNWAEVMSGWPDTAYWNGHNLDYPTDTQGPMMVGRDPAYGDVTRGLFQMNTSSINGKHILKATFQITEKWANNCQATPVQLWETGGINSGTTFHHQPTWNKMLSEQSAAHGNEAFGCNDGEVDFNATQAVVDAAAAGWPNLTLGLRATDEGDVSGWKRFDISPTLAINYNSVPNQPTDLTVDGKGCVTGSGRPFIGTATPTLRATVSDPDAGTLLNTSFYWAPVGGTTNGTDKVTQNSVATGSQAVVTVPAGKLTDGGSYFFQVQDTDGKDTSPWSAQCEFTVDSTRPDKPPAVASTDYPDDGDFHGGMGQTGGFTLSANGVTDVAGYRYGWADPPTTQVNVGLVSGDATITATPPAQGLNTLYVRSVDRAGNLSDITSYVFLAGGPTGPVGWWKSDEGSGSTLADASGGGHPATLVGSTSWTDGRLHDADRAVTYDGSTGYAETSGPVLHTDQSFTVAAWVVLPSADTGGTWRTAVSQNGSMASSVMLGYSGSGWAFSVHSADAAASSVTSYTVVAPAAPTTQAWVHLAGVYDAGTHQLSLYVNGRLAASTGNAYPYDSRSTVDIGRELCDGKWLNWWPGQVDDVRLWQRVVYTDEITKVADGAVLVGGWNFDDDAGAAAADSTGYHPAQLTGDYTWTSGHDGLGAAHFGGATSSAYTAGQVVHTDSSFSVAAWVRLTDTSGVRGVVSEDGVAVSGFQLQYEPACTCWEGLMPEDDHNDPPTKVVRGPSGAAVGVWTHLAFVYDDGTNTMTLYVNGAAAATATGPSNLWGATRVLAIGRTLWNGSQGSRFVGDIDDVGVYAGVLTDADVANLFNE